MKKLIAITEKYLIPYTVDDNIITIDDKDTITVKEGNKFEPSFLLWLKDDADFYDVYERIIKEYSILRDTLISLEQPLRERGYGLQYSIHGRNFIRTKHNLIKFEFKKEKFIYGDVVISQNILLSDIVMDWIAGHLRLYDEKWEKEKEIKEYYLTLPTEKEVKIDRKITKLLDKC